MEEDKILEPIKKKRSLKEIILNASHTKYGFFLVNFISFIESSFFPIPPDFLMVPMVISKPAKWKKLAFWITIFSVLGAIFGYIIGFFIFEEFGKIIIEKYNLTEEVIKIGKLYNKNAFLAILTSAFTPIPFKLFTISAGIFKVNIITLIIASIIGRGGRFFLVAYISHIGGKTMANKYLKKMENLMWILVFLILLFLAFLIVK